MTRKVEGSKVEEQSDDIENGGQNSYPDLAASLEKEFVGLSQNPLSFDSCIYRVPERLRCVNEKMYTPKVVSIGPLHHGKPNLKVMEDQKMRYLRDFQDRTKVRVEVYIEKIKKQEKKLRNCYQAEGIGEIDGDKFVKIILVDAAFIIELLLRSYERSSQYSQGNKSTYKKLDKVENDPIFGKPCMIYSIVADLFLLENQLPFFILEDLYVAGGISQTNLFEVAFSFVNRGDLNVEEASEAKGVLSSGACEVKHFVDLKRTLLLLWKESETPRRKLTRISGAAFVDVTGVALKDVPQVVPSTHTITYLHRAGVKLKVVSSKNIFDIELNNGILRIPRIKMDDHTELILRNLIAFEQCHYSPAYYLGDYIYILDQFVNTTEDVDLLVEEKVVENMLGDNKQVCELINKLCVGVYVSNNFNFSTLCGNLDDYCKKRRHKWMATLRQDYFNTPWALISFVAAFVLLVLTVISTMCSFDIC